MAEHNQKQLPLLCVDEFFDAHGLTGVARAMGYRSAEIGSLSHTLWKGIAVELLKREGLLDTFIRENWRNGSSEEGKKYLRRVESTYRRYVKGS